MGSWESCDWSRSPSGIGSVSELVGCTIVRCEIDKGADAFRFTLDNGESFSLHHEQDCCECVDLEDVCGDVSDLVGAPLVVAEESRQDDPAATASATWTFYRFATAKGDVSLRWYGVSNGYYSETAVLYWWEPEEPPAPPAPPSISIDALPPLEDGWKWVATSSPTLVELWSPLWRMGFLTLTSGAVQTYLWSAMAARKPSDAVDTGADLNMWNAAKALCAAAGVRTLL